MLKFKCKIPAPKGSVILVRRHLMNNIPFLKNLPLFRMNCLLSSLLLLAASQGPYPVIITWFPLSASLPSQLLFFSSFGSHHTIVSPPFSSGFILHYYLVCVSLYHYIHIPPFAHYVWYFFLSPFDSFSFFSLPCVIFFFLLVSFLREIIRNVVFCNVLNIVLSFF